MVGLRWTFRPASMTWEHGLTTKAKPISPQMKVALAKIAALPQPERAKVAQQALRMLQLVEDLHQANLDRQLGQ